MSYEDEYEYIEESFDDLEAKSRRDKRAKELRKQGYDVQIETKEPEYRVFAEKKKQK